MLLDRIDHLLDHINAQAPAGGVRLDSSNTIFLKRQLQAVEARVYRKKYRDLTWRRLLPIQADQGRGPRTFSYNIMDSTGSAAFVEPGGGDLPTVGLKQDEVIGKYRSFGDKFIYTWDDLDAANFANIPLQAELALAARHKFEILANDTIHHGYAKLGLNGLISDLSLLTQYTVLADGTGSTDADKRKFINKTGAQMFKAVMGLLITTSNATENAFDSNYLVAPVAQINLMTATMMSEYDQRSVMQAIKEACEKRGIDLQVIPDNELAGAGPNGTDLMVAYPFDEEVAAIKLPMDFTMFSMVLNEDGHFSVPCWGRTGGVVLRHPKGVAYAAGI